MSTPKPKDDDNVEALAKYLGRAQIDESYGVPTEWKNEDGTNEHRDARFGILQDEVVKKAEDEAKPPPSRPARSSAAPTTASSLQRKASAPPQTFVPASTFPSWPTLTQDSAAQ